MNMEEAARYNPALLTQDVLIDLMSELQAYRDIAENARLDSPEELAAYVDELETKSGQCNDEDHSNFDDYKAFFDDAVSTIENAGGRWPCAEPCDTTLTAYLLQCIERGAEVLSAEEGE